MNDATGVLTDHTQKNKIPLSHLDTTYIQQCTDGIELERIYKLLISGELGSNKILEQLTLDRIRKIQSNDEISRQDQIPINISTSSNNLSQQTNIINSISNSSNINNGNSTISEPIINNDFTQTEPKSNEEWAKFEQQVSSDFNSDHEDHDNELLKNQSDEDNKRLYTSAQYRLNGDTTFKLNDYQQSIDLYTKSIALDKNSITYMKRAMAFFKLENFDASIQDYSQVLLINSKDIQALFRRASCYFTKQQYDKAKNDLDHILLIDPDNDEAQNLLNTVLTVRNMNSNPSTGDNKDFGIESPITVSLKIPPLDSEDEEEQQVNNNMTHSMNIDIPQNQNMHSDLNSRNLFSTTFDYHNINQFQMSSLHDDEDDMALGDEASGGLVVNISDDEGHVVRSANVSPTNDDDSDVPELSDQKPLDEISIGQNNKIDQSIAFAMHENNKQDNVSTKYHHQTSDDYDDLYDRQINRNIPTLSQNSSSYKQNTNYQNSWTNHNDPYMRSTSVSDAISNSNFGSTIQNWLHDFVKSQPSHRFSSCFDRPWSKTALPWSLNKILGDIQKFNRLNDYKNAIDVSKKLLHNGILALQYNKNDGDVLIHRAKGFEHEKFFLFSYADYVRVPSNNFSYHLTRRACEKLEIELNSTEDKAWREKLSNDKNDDEHYLTYLKIKYEYSENNAYEWYQTYADQLYLDACFVLAIQCYTFCIELQPNTTYAYLKRAECYLNVFEACDIWSLGVIMYILLSGYPPFYPEGNRMLSSGMKNRITAGAYEYPEREWENISSQAKSTINQMLTVDTALRITIDEVLKCSWLTELTSTRPIHMVALQDEEDRRQLEVLASATDSQRRTDDDLGINISGPEASRIARRAAKRKQQNDATNVKQNNESNMN
ncbi:unnamed protein product [Rotaria sp. Silwood2]|nr:unnamed protein product [Rotaria sp. Silwood2]